MNNIPNNNLKSHLCCLRSVVHFELFAYLIIFNDSFLTIDYDIQWCVLYYITGTVTDSFSVICHTCPECVG